MCLIYIPNLYAKSGSLDLPDFLKCYGVRTHTHTHTPAQTPDPVVFSTRILLCKTLVVTIRCLLCCERAECLWSSQLALSHPCIHLNQFIVQKPWGVWSLTEAKSRACLD